MNKQMKRMAVTLLAACMLAVFAPVHMLTAYAANARIAFSDPSATVGGQVSVNMKITSTSGENLSSADIMLSYDSSALEFVSGTDATGGSGAIRVHGDAGTPNTTALAFTLKFNALTAGTTKIEVSNQEIYDTNSQLVTVEKQGNSTVTVKALATASKDATLKSLQVSPGTLTPEFSPDVDTYAVTVGTDVNKIIVSAECNDANATKIIKNNEDLQMGENRVTCRVTAQDGETAKEYVIVVTKAEGGASNTGGGDNGVQIKMTSMAKNITILEPDSSVKLPEGFVETSINIDGNKVKGWIWKTDTNPQYCVVYGMNEAGEKNFYRYDMGTNEHTIQRYFQDPAADIGVSNEKYEALVTDYNSLVKDYDGRLIVIIILAVIAVILLILLLWQIVSKNKPSDPGSGPRGTSRAKRGGEPEDADDAEDYEPAEQEILADEDGEAFGQEPEDGGDDGFDIVDVLDDEDDEAYEAEEDVRFEPQVRRARGGEGRVQSAADRESAVTREPAAAVRTRRAAEAEEPRRSSAARPQGGPAQQGGSAVRGGHEHQAPRPAARSQGEPAVEARPQRAAGQPRAGKAADKLQPRSGAGEKARPRTGEAAARPQSPAGGAGKPVASGAGNAAGRERQAARAEAGKGQPMGTRPSGRANAASGPAEPRAPKAVQPVRVAPAPAAKDEKDRRSADDDFEVFDLD